MKDELNGLRRVYLHIIISLWELEQSKDREIDYDHLVRGDVPRGPRGRSL